jgi:hypothetical protein
VVAAGAEPSVALHALARPTRTLADLAPVTRAFGVLAGRRDAREERAAPVQLAVVAQPFLLDERRARLPSAPVVVTLGREDGDVVVRASVAFGLLREATRLSFGP